MARTIAFFLLALLLTCPVAQAQSRLPATAPEDVAIAFFKLSETRPDLDALARKSDGYMIAAPALAEETLQQEKQRLGRRLQSYDTTRPLVVKATVVIRLNADGRSARIEYGRSQTMLYFPYHYRGYDIAALPVHEDSFRQISLSGQQARMLKPMAGKTGTVPARIELLLSPARAYGNRPYDLDGTEQWFLFVTLSDLTIFSPDGRSVLWSQSYR